MKVMLCAVKLELIASQIGVSRYVRYLRSGFTTSTGPVSFHGRTRESNPGFPSPSWSLCPLYHIGHTVIKETSINEHSNPVVLVSSHNILQGNNRWKGREIEDRLWQCLV